MFVFNQSKSAPVNKDQFKPYYSCHFTLTRIYLYAQDTSTPLFMILIISTQPMQSNLFEKTKSNSVNLLGIVRMVFVMSLIKHR